MAHDVGEALDFLVGASEGGRAFGDALLERFVEGQDLVACLDKAFGVAGHDHQSDRGKESDAQTA